MKLTLLLLTIFSLLGCSSEDDFEPPYPVIDSGYWAERHLPNEIQWLDDERVLFVGKKPGARREHKGLHVWTLGGDVVLYKLGARGLCLQGDTVSYIVRKNVGDVSGYFQGKYGDETRRDRQSYSDKLNCRTLSAYPGNEVDQVWKLLLDGHGYLDVGKLVGWIFSPPRKFLASCRGLVE